MTIEATPSVEAPPVVEKQSAVPGWLTTIPRELGEFTIGRFVRGLAAAPQQWQWWRSGHRYLQEYMEWEAAADNNRGDPGVLARKTSAGERLALELERVHAREQTVAIVLVVTCLSWLSIPIGPVSIPVTPIALLATAALCFVTAYFTAGFARISKGRGQRHAENLATLTSRLVLGSAASWALVIGQHFGLPDWLAPGVVGVGALGWLVVVFGDGTAADNIADPATKEQGPVTEVAIVNALMKSSVKLPKDADPVVVPPGVSWPVKDKVWRATLETSGSVNGPSAAPIVAAKDRTDFAARLGLGPSRFDAVLDKERGSRVHLTGVVGDPLGAPTRSPLMSVDSWNVFRDGVPFGEAQTDLSRITLPTFERNWLFGGLPGEGKSAATYPFQAAYVLDPNAWICAIDGGEVDTRPLYDAGLTTMWVGGKDIPAAIELLHNLEKELERYQSLLGEFGREHKGANGKKASEEFFAWSGLGPGLLIWDELASFTSSPDKKLSGTCMSLAMTIFQRIRKLGIGALLSTQSPSAKSIDTDGRDVISDRFALPCKTPDMSDKILGAGHASAGVCAASTLVSKERVGWLSNAEGDRKVRADWFTDEDLQQVYRRGVALRGGRARKVRTVDLPPWLVHAAQLMRQHQVASMRSAEIVGRFGTAGIKIPEGQKGQNMLAAEMGRYEVGPIKVRGDGNLKHYLLADVERALQRLEQGWSPQ